MIRLARLGLLLAVATAAGCLYPSLKTVTGTTDVSGGANAWGSRTGGAVETGGRAGNNGATGGGGGLGTAGTVAATTAGVVAAGGTPSTGGANGNSPPAAVTTLTAARFNWPSGVAVDRAGNIFVADWKNNDIRKITPGGVVTTLAGAAGLSGSADGTGAAASFNGPTGVAADGLGNILVADGGNNTIRKITSAGVVTTLAGTAGSSGNADGTGAAASFRAPQGIAVDGSGDILVADSGNNTIRKITSAGAVTTLAGTAGSSGAADGTGSAASFRLSAKDYISMAGLAVDGSGDIFVADTWNDTIRKITPAGVVTTLAGTVGSSRTADGIGPAASFNYPNGVAVDGTGNVFVADSGLYSRIRKITPTGAVTTLAGTGMGSADGTGAGASFNGPEGVALDGAGNLFIADSCNGTIRKITLAGM